MKTIIGKLGGNALALGKQILFNLISIMVNQGGNVIFVVSAFAGVTRILDSIFLAMKERKYEEIDLLFNKFKDIHTERMKELDVDMKILDSYFEQIDLFIHMKVFSEDNTIDQAQLLQYGELCSSLVFNSFVSTNFEQSELIDARIIIMAREDSPSFISGEVDIFPTLNNIQIMINPSVKLIVTQGFIATSFRSGFNSVLWYDGSDKTAAVIVFSLLRIYQTMEVTLIYWKDILGVFRDIYNMDLGIFDLMEMPEYLDFSDDNSVPVRPDSIELLLSLKEKELARLQIFIRSSFQLDNPGTRIV